MAERANVYRHVILKKVAAGSGIHRTLNKEPDAVKKQLRIIFETPGSAPHPLGVHPRVPKDVQQAISDAIIELALDPVNSHLLQTVQIPKPSLADYKRDYQPLEKLGIEEFVSATEK